MHFQNSATHLRGEREQHNLKGGEFTMTDHGRGGILAAATSLPATSAGLILTNHVHPAVVAALFAISIISFAVSVTYVVRYMRNRYN
jgi:hypothetical protein